MLPLSLLPAAGGGLGGLLGGWIGDKAAARFPDHGRIAATQFSVIIGIPFAVLLIKVGVGACSYFVFVICTCMRGADQDALAGSSRVRACMLTG